MSSIGIVTVAATAVVGAIIFFVAGVFFGAAIAADYGMVE